MKMYSLMSVRISLVFGVLSILIVPHTSSVSFNFMNFSNCNTSGEYINFQADAFCKSNNSTVSLTSQYTSGDYRNSFGRATYKQPVPLWDEKSGGVINFTTKFSFRILTGGGSLLGDGFTFFLAPYPSQIPENASTIDGYFALFEQPNNVTNPSKNQIVAVEFDTWSNKLFDPSGIGCHVGVNINTINSISFISANTCFIVDSLMTARIEYNSGLKLLSVLLWRDDDPKIKYNLNATVDISKVLPNISVVGFSALSYRTYAELYHIYSWSFETMEVKQHPHPPSRIASTIGGIGAGVFLVLILTGFMIYCLKRKKLISNTKETELIDFEIEKGKGPKKFTHRELVVATNGFAEINKLGEGGFGSVYRGILANENIHVAVKRVSKESKQGKKEYISEVNIITQLRHRNLVQLVGWCHDRGELLLVYELVHNGSLDTHLYCNGSVLTWPIRQNIALGLGHALLYLHEECELCVVHRDIKPSNIMLDSSFNAKLGDFGLARLTDHHRDLQTTIVAGTKGYMAPEYIFGIANASTQSDVFSFGVVLLEMVCGRLPIMQQQDQKKVNLVEWVWDLYGQNMLMEAVDGRLNGNFERNEVECFMIVGLWCAYPEKSLRPSIRQAMSVLQFQAGLPILPPKMPVPVYAAPVLYPDNM